MSFAIDQLAQRARQWNVTIHNTRERPTSLIAFGERHQTPVVIKISKQPDDEWHAGEVLRAFAGDGTVRVYESEPGAVLLERLDPGHDLVNMVRQRDDERATIILAKIMESMARHSPPESCPTVSDWARGFDRYLQSGDTQIDPMVVTEAARLYRRLALSQGRTMLLHGDLQHYNVLFDSTRGWVAIDPKGVVGELEYEVGAILRNPIELPDLLAARHVVEMRLRILMEAPQLNYRRALEWSYAQAVLSAVWDVEDGYPVDPNHVALKLAHVVKPMLDKK